MARERDNAQLTQYSARTQMQQFVDELLGEIDKLRLQLAEREQTPTATSSSRRRRVPRAADQRPPLPGE
jgi:hypothetical protein